MNERNTGDEYADDPGVEESDATPTGESDVAEESSDIETEVEQDTDDADEPDVEQESSDVDADVEQDTDDIDPDETVVITTDGKGGTSTSAVPAMLAEIGQSEDDTDIDATQVIAPVEEGDENPLGEFEEAPERKTFFTRSRVVGIGIGVAALLIGGTLFSINHANGVRAEREAAEQASIQAAEQASIEAAEQAQMQGAIDALTAAMESGQETLNLSDGLVGEGDSSRTSLTESIEVGGSLLATWSTDPLVYDAEGLTALNAATDEVNAASDAVTTAVNEYAASRLATAIEQGQAVVDSTEGKVSDDSLRVALADAISAGSTALGVENYVGADLDAARAVIEAAVTPVTEDNTAWQAAEDKRIADEAAAAAAAAEEAERERQQSSSSSSSSGSNSSSSSSSGSNSSSSGSNNSGGSNSSSGSNNSGGSSGGNNNSGGSSGGNNNSGGSTGGNNSGGGNSSFGPSYVSGVVQQYANPGSGTCSPMGQFAGDSGYNWASAAKSIRDQHTYVKFSVSGSSTWVTVSYSTCLAP